MSGKKNLRARVKKITLTPQFIGGKQSYKGSDGLQYTVEQANSMLIQGRAVRTSWHGGKKTDSVSYEGAQYRGGRKEGRKNLVKTETGFINQHGIEFTAAERKQLENLVNRANYKRKKMIIEEGSLPRMVNGKHTGETVSVLQSMNKESDFIISRKSKSLQRFKSREDFDRYMSNLEKVLSDDYIDEKTRLYKRNHIKALENVFGDDAKDVVNKIRSMRLKDYREMIQSDEMVEVNYIYDPSELQGKLNQIRKSMGMKLKEEFIGDTE